MPDFFPYPPSVQHLIEEFAKLPGIGRRSAERLAYHILATPREEALALATAIRDVKTQIRACRQCFHITEGERCAICEDPSRDRRLLCVVELPRDIIAIEKSGVYRGLYHVLQGTLQPAAGIGPEALRIRELVSRIERSRESETPIQEVMLATNPTTEGDATASYLHDLLLPLGIRVTRLARGLASGTDLESTAPSSLRSAIEGRREI